MKHAGRVVLFGVGCAVFAYVMARLGIAKTVSFLLEIGWSFASMAAIYGAHQFMRTAAYRECIASNRGSSFWTLLRIRLSGEAIQFLPFTGPFLAEPAKAWLLKKQGLDLKDAVAATVSENLVYTLTSAAFAAAALSYLLRFYKLSGPLTVAVVFIIFAMSAFLMVAAFAIVRRFYLIGATLAGLKKVPALGKYLRLDRSDIRATEDLLFVVLRDHPLRFLAILAFELAAQAMLVAETFVFLTATRQTLTPGEPLLIEGAAKFIGPAFFFIPGQVGASEGSFALIFTTIGLPASAGFALALARRLRSLLTGGVGFLLASLSRDKAG